MKGDKQGAIRLNRREAVNIGLGTLISSAVAATGTRAADGTQAADATGQERRAIDRQAVVTRHNIRVTSSSELQVGNGEFAITTDISGLISFSNNATLAHWGWHSDPLPSGQTIDDFQWTIHRGYDGRERPYPLPDGSDIGKWLMSNPHKANLGRLSLILIKEDGSTAGMEDLQNREQTLDLWKGLLTSRYDIDGQPVKVETCVHPTLDAIAVRIASPLISAGRLRIKLTFPYPNLVDGGSGDFNRPDAHTSTMESRGRRRADISRTADATSYNAGLIWAGGGNLEEPARHEFLLSPEAADQFEFVCAFTPQALPETLPSATETIDACAKHWPDFWNSGGAIDLSGSRDSRWKELERRIVMSQYAMVVNEAGSYPPPESGLRKGDPWHGRFHFEMIWWHGTHWAAWDRWPMLNRYIDIYQRYLPGAQETARKQEYKGARWFKCTGNTPVEWPWSSHSWLVWQHPHPIFFAEMDYRAHPTTTTLNKWREVVFNTADFLASFPSPDKENPEQLVLGFPIEDMCEQNPHFETINPSFDLGYFRFGLRIAQRWRERLAMPRDAHYDHVLEHLSPIPVRDGVYIMWESVSRDSGLRDISVDPWANPKWISDHPSLAGLYGMLPGDGVDLETMQRTYDQVLQTWPRYKWGWDYGMMAMAAARLGRPETAVDFLLHPDNRYTANGISGGWYFPGNGALLYAVAMMAAGWDGCPEGNAPGFPDDGSWTVKWEGLKPALGLNDSLDVTTSALGGGADATTPLRESEQLPPRE